MSKQSDDIIGFIVGAFLVLLGLFLLPGIIKLIWLIISGVWSMVIGFVLFIDKLFDLFLDAFPVLCIFILPACFAFVMGDDRK